MTETVIVFNVLGGVGAILLCVLLSRGDTRRRRGIITLVVLLAYATLSVSLYAVSLPASTDVGVTAFGAVWYGCLSSSPFVLVVAVITLVALALQRSRNGRGQA